MPKDSRRSRLLVVATVVAVFAALFQVGVADAAPPVPTGLSPNGGVVGANPQLTWNPSPGALTYDVQISANPSMTPLLSNGNVNDTPNTSYSPPDELPVGTIYWQVRATDPNGDSGWSPAQFNKVLDGPGLISPPDGTTLQFPTEPPTFAWDTLPTAKSYVVEVDDADDFIGAEKIVTSNPTTTLTDTQVLNQTYYWRVRGSSNTGGTGILTEWSDVWEYDVQWTNPSPMLIGPPNTTPLTAVTDVELVWNPVLGAKNYQIQVNRSNDFTGEYVDDRTVYGTRYSPEDTFNNGAYHWRVRPRDEGGHLGEWSEVFSFTRNWTPSPNLAAPTDNQVMLDPLEFSWSPVDHASEYEIQVSDDVNFSPGHFRSCSTLQTKVTPYTMFQGSTFGSCSSFFFGYVGDGPPQFWRVRGIDEREGILGLWSSIRTFGDWAPPRAEPLAPLGVVTQTGPAHCPPGNPNCQKLTSSPTYTWDHLPGASYYLVTMAFDTNFTNTIKTYRVNQNFFIPREEYPDNDAGQAYYWHVRPCRSDNICGPDPQGTPNPPQRAFQKRSDKVQLTTPANGAVVANQPRFAWQDYLASNGSDIEAERYQVQVSTVPTFATTIFDERVDQTFVTPFDRTFPEGPLYWRVRAIDGSGNELTWSNEAENPLVFRSMTKTSPPPVMQTPGANANINGQPSFSWLPQAFAEGYRLEVAKNADLNFSPANEVLDEATAHAAFTPEDPLAPGTYAWRIRREDGQGKDGPWTAGRLFTVSQAAPTLLTPVNGAQVANDQFVFTWTPLPRAVSYRFERSANAQFAPIAETRNTVMTSWAPIVSYPQQMWFWRVKALDAQGNIIGTSNTFQFNRGPEPLASIPQNLQVQQTPGRLRLSWQPPSYQGVPQFNEYVVNLQPGNVTRVLNRNTTNTTFNGLINGNLYTATVVARNSAGDGPAALRNGTPNGCTQTTFSDIPATHLFCSEIRWMFTTGLSIGSVASDGTVSYQPSQPVSRGAMATFLYRYAGSPSVPTTAPHFADVPSNHLFFKEIQWMFKSGNSTGFPNPAGGKPLFKPADAVDRGGMAAFMYRSAGKPSVIPSAPHFADVGVGHIFFGPIQWMFQSGVSFGTPNPPGKPWYSPNQSLARDAMAAFLFRYDQVVP